MKSIFEFEKIYLHRAPVDMRKNIYGLSAIVASEMRLDLKASSLFIFCNQRRSLMKILYFDLSGFALWMKKLEDSKFSWPLNSEQDVVTVTAKDLELLLQGMNIWTRFKEIEFEHVF